MRIFLKSISLLNDIINLEIEVLVSDIYLDLKILPFVRYRIKWNVFSILLSYVKNKIGREMPMFLNFLSLNCTE